MILRTGEAGVAHRGRDLEEAGLGFTQQPVAGDGRCSSSPMIGRHGPSLDVGLRGAVSGRSDVRPAWLELETTTGVKAEPGLCRWTVLEWEPGFFAIRRQVRATVPVLADRGEELGQAGGQVDRAKPAISSSGPHRQAKAEHSGTGRPAPCWAISSIAHVQPARRVTVFDGPGRMSATAADRGDVDARRGRRRRTPPSLRRQGRSRI